MVYKAIWVFKKICEHTCMCVDTYICVCTYDFWKKTRKFLLTLVTCGKIL